MNHKKATDYEWKVPKGWNLLEIENTWVNSLYFLQELSGEYPVLVITICKLPAPWLVWGFWN